MNPHALRHMILSHACLPIPACPHTELSVTIIRHNLDFPVYLIIEKGRYAFLFSYNFKPMTFIKTETAGKDRNKLVRDILITIRELNQESSFEQASRDKVAFISLNLYSIYKGIDESVLAWEKRNYWAKADKFRMEWQWTLYSAREIKNALINEDIPAMMNQFAVIFTKFSQKTLPKSARVSRPWQGSEKTLRELKDI